MRSKPLCVPRFLLLGGLSLLAACDSPRFEVLAPLPTQQLDALGIQSPVQAVHYRDREGEALLVLSRNDDQVRDAESGEDLDRVLLTATLYGRAAGNDEFKARWKIEHETDCSGLDLDVGFYTDVSGASDLNSDGVAELTVASHAFCGGGVDSHELRVELREGQARYAIVGQSLITPPGEAPFGGEREDSPSLQSAPAVLRGHLDSVWNKVLTRPWSEIAPAPEDSDEP
ncbi:M949_RS01915 family surface polysaccharide biosynthesis protein [Pseudomonas alkylphenolica]|jgi:hypothetical protein|uniref:M949_RS01915 family surface polysaccharide biosynthesis protein n=1 Tax=Pseudomonas TaxID=286 RepID=UPI0005EBBAA8|nr:MULTISPECIES: hypothetical protein [unclassified Pseudomonas]KJK07239.1 hypothetical protein UB47_13455 [Pseudomonas sp. 5]QYX47524.1 hypothetical protein K3F43_23065 [Pseudomonas sp. S11A 273]